jgi:hypothetical protein
VLVAAATLAAGNGGLIYVSTNGGNIWNSTTATNGRWDTVSCSADGTKMLAGLQSGGLYVSTNSGGTWTLSNLSVFETWIGTAASADGNKLFALDGNGGIYTSQTTPHPVLSATPGVAGLTLSWTVPSTNFVVQQNLNLETTNWAGVTNSPVLNPANLQEQLTLSPANNAGFFRLKSQ